MLEIIVASKPQGGEAESERGVFYQSKKQTNCISAAEAGQDITLWREMQLTEKIYSRNKTLKKSNNSISAQSVFYNVFFWFHAHQPVSIKWTHVLSTAGTSCYCVLMAHFHTDTTWCGKKTCSVCVKLVRSWNSSFLYSTALVLIWAIWCSHRILSWKGNKWDITQ